MKALPLGCGPLSPPSDPAGGCASGDRRRPSAGPAPGLVEERFFRVLIRPPPLPLSPEPAATNRSPGGGPHAGDALQSPVAFSCAPARIPPWLSGARFDSIQGGSQAGDFLRSHVFHEPQQWNRPIVAVGQDRSNQLRGVIRPSSCRGISVSPPIGLPSEEAFAVKVVHHGHHRRVCQLAVSGQVVKDLSDRRRTSPRPETVHHYGFEISERTQRDSPFDLVWCTRSTHHYPLA